MVSPRIKSRMKQDAADNELQCNDTIETQSTDTDDSPTTNEEHNDLDGMNEDESNDSEDDTSMAEDDSPPVNEQGNEYSEETKTKDEEWQTGWSLWLSYRAKHGTGQVTHVAEGTALHAWVKRQEEDYAKFQQGESTFLGEEGYGLMKRMGFVFPQDENNSRKRAAKTTRSSRKRSAAATSNTTDHAIRASKCARVTEEKKAATAKKVAITNKKKKDAPKKDAPPKKDVLKKFMASSPQLDKEWEEQLQELIKFKEQNGHVCVPKSYPENKKLSLWVFHQRRHKRLRDRGEETSLTDERLAKLEAVGFIFNTRRNQEFFHYRVAEIQSEAWEASFAKLQAYKEQTGNCLVPKVYEPDQSLSTWVQRQRHQYRMLQEGKLNTMHPERLQRLEDAGFVFNTKTSDVRKFCNMRGHAHKWDQHFQALVDFKKKHGHTQVPKNYPPNKTLGNWVKRQRGQCKLFSQGESCLMTQERFQRLADIGFAFVADRTLSANTGNALHEVDQQEEV